jgi:hypothetical protein
MVEMMKLGRKKLNLKDTVEKETQSSKGEGKHNC